MNFVTQIPENVWLTILKSVILEIVKENVVEGLVNAGTENVPAKDVLKEIIARIVISSNLSVVVNQSSIVGGVLADV